MNDPYGSIWRKWDLHVHTPCSVLNNEFPNDFDEYARTLFRRGTDEKIAAIGITDYFTIDGYTKLLAILNDDARLTKLCGTDKVVAAVRKILFIPNIELRTHRAPP